MSGRLFFALEVPRHVRFALKAVRDRWDETDRVCWRWVDPHLYHLTLVFLGSRPEAELGVIIAAGRSAAGRSARFPLTCEGLGAFPNPRRSSRVLWAGVVASPPLSALVDSLRQELKLAGLPSDDDRPYRGHVTLARRRSQGRSATHPLPSSLSAESWGTWTVDRLVLLESRNLKGALVYEKRAAWPLSHSQ
jgi:2'-5' RNA ligase